MRCSVGLLLIAAWVGAYPAAVRAKAGGAHAAMQCGLGRLTTAVAAPDQVALSRAQVDTAEAEIVQMQAAVAAH